MAALQKFQVFAGDLGKGVHNLDADDLKVALSNVAPNLATFAVLSDVTQIAVGFGYPAGGPSLANPSYSQTSGLGKLLADDLTVTATGGPLPTFRYAYLYNDTHPSKPLIGVWDRGSGLTLADGQSWLLDLSPTNGILQIG